MEERSRFLRYGAGATGTAVAVVALGPDEWTERISAWQDALGVYLYIAVAFAVGVVSVLVWSKWREPSHKSREGIRGSELHLMTQKSFEMEANRLLQDDAPIVLKIFGYTGETVLNDVFRFDDRYRTNLDVRSLHRSWLVEQSDEERQNALFPDRRPWRKSEGIRRVGTEPWIHPQQRQFRYYEHQPCIKGMIITKQRTDEKYLFLTFFRWVKEPDGGGSVFKGIELPFICVQGNERQARLFIDGIESQFDYEWIHSVSSAQVENGVGTGN